MTREVLWPIISAEALKEKVPITDKAQIVIDETKAEVQAVLDGRSNKKIMVVWPCSADFEDSLLEYAARLKTLKEEYGDQFVFVMRFYTWKPRTVGWWTWINSWPLWEIASWEWSDSLNKWLEYSRKLAIKLMEESWIGLADEMLHPHFYNHFDDIYSYLAVWARTTESPDHRQIASFSDIPFWMKNWTDWSVKTWVNSVEAAQMKYVLWVWNTAYQSNWNEYAHLVLRWGNWWKSNYQIEFIQEAYDDMIARWIENPAVIIDLNHENSWKNPLKQIEIMKEVIASLEWNEDLQRFVKWFMIESYIFDGRQDIPADGDMTKVTHWKSLTDPCLGIDWTEKLFEEALRLLKKDEQ